MRQRHMENFSVICEEPKENGITSKEYQKELFKGTS